MSLFCWPVPVQRADEACEEGTETTGQTRQGAQRARTARAHPKLPAQNRRPDSRVP